MIPTVALPAWMAFPTRSNSCSKLDVKLKRSIRWSIHRWSQMSNSRTNQPISHLEESPLLQDIKPPVSLVSLRFMTQSSPSRRLPKILLRSRPSFPRYSSMTSSELRRKMKLVQMLRQLSGTYASQNPSLCWGRFSNESITRFLNLLSSEYSPLQIAVESCHLPQRISKGR